MKTLVFVTHRRLDNDPSGSKTYLRRLMILAEESGYSLKILCLPRTTFSNRPWSEITAEFTDNAEVIWPNTKYIAGRYVTLAPSVWARFGKRLIQEALAKLNIGPMRWQKPQSNLATVPPKRELQIAADSLKTIKPAAVIVEYSSLGPLLDLLPISIGKALIVHDSFAARSEFFKSQDVRPDYPDPPGFEEEAGRMSGADQIYHASVNELNRFEQLMGTEQDHIWFRPTATVFRDKTVQRSKAELVYIGANQQGSRDAINHFLNDVWPLIVAAVPDAKINIVGPVGASIDNELATSGVHICGRVEHLYDFAGPDMIGILPTRLMSGISIKVGEYLGMGLPRVAYPAGIDGYGDALNDIVQTGSTAEAFAKVTAKLLNDSDLRQKLSQDGIEAAETTLQNPQLLEAMRALAK